MPVPLLAFDMGNVLLPFDHTLACKRLANRCGVSANTVYGLIFESGLEEQFERGAIAPNEFADEVSNRLMTNFTRDWLQEAWSDIFFHNQQMLDLVHKLGQRNELHLVSNTNEWHFSYVAAKFPVLQYFPNRTLSYEVHSFKPEAQMFRCISDQIGKDRLIVYIDDVPTYVAAASALGARGHVFTSIDELSLNLRKLGLLTD